MDTLRMLVAVGASLVMLSACGGDESNAGAGGSGIGGVGGSGGMGGRGGMGGDASVMVDGGDASREPNDAGADSSVPTDAGDAGGDASVPIEAAAVVRMLHRVNPDDDSYIASANNGDGAARAWLSTHWQAFEGFSGGPTPAANSWLDGGLLYFDTTAVNIGANPPDEHILKRTSNGERCYNPWGGNPNPQLSWNVTSPATRAYLIARMQEALAAHPWDGLWLDDVNLEIGSSCVGPNDEDWYTERGSDWPDTWATAVVTFMEEIRAAFPNKTLLQNAPWFSRQPERWTDPLVMRQLSTASLANREGGILDDGLTTGSGYWSVNALFDYVDAVHASGAGVVWDSFPSSLDERKYALAAYFIGYTDKDFYGDMSAREPSSWPSLYDIDLGRPLGPRTFDGDATFRREFEQGTVVLNVSTKTGTLPGVP